MGCNPDSVSVLAHIYNLSTKNILMAQRDIRVTVSKIETALKFQESVRRIAVSSFKTVLLVFQLKPCLFFLDKVRKQGYQPLKGQRCHHDCVLVLYLYGFAQQCKQMFSTNASPLYNKRQSKQFLFEFYGKFVLIFTLTVINCLFTDNNKISGSPYFVCETNTN